MIERGRRGIYPPVPVPCSAGTDPAGSAYSVKMSVLAVFYFSGTGNTRYIAEYLSQKLSCRYTAEMFDICRVDHAEDKIKAADLILLAFPIYGSAPPIPMRNFVHKYGGLFRGKRFLLAETQYFYSGDGAASLGRTVRKYGGVILGAEMFNMPNNLADCKMFPIKNGEEIAPVLEKAKLRADKFAQQICRRGRAHKRGFSRLSHGVGYFTQRKFFRKGESEKRRALKVDETRCVGCGLCAKSCPAENLLLQNKKAKPLGKCVLCYRCVNLCPKKAITLVGSAPPAKQYKGPSSGGDS